MQKLIEQYSLPLGKNRAKNPKLKSIMILYSLWD
jgi:hypothetical protein